MGFGKSFKRSVKRWTRGLANTAKFWNPKKVRKGMYQQLGATKADPLGRSLSRYFNPHSPVSSAASFQPRRISEMM